MEIIFLPSIQSIQYILKCAIDGIADKTLLKFLIRSDPVDPVDPIIFLQFGIDGIDGIADQKTMRSSVPVDPVDPSTSFGYTFM